jgi:hypothetical protein
MTFASEGVELVHATHSTTWPVPHTETQRGGVNKREFFRMHRNERRRPCRGASFSNNPEETHPHLCLQYDLNNVTM